MKNYRIKSIAIIFLFAIISNTFLFEKPAKCEITQTKNILILNSYSKGIPYNGFNINNWGDEIISGVESQFESNKENINISIDYMDTSYNFSDEYYDKLYELYKNKFNNIKFDAVITIDNNATSFLTKYGNSLFPNTPVVFCGVNKYKKPTINNLPLFTGIYKNEDIKSTFDIALKFHPNTKEFFVIIDNASMGLNFRTSIEKLPLEYKNEVDFIFCDDNNIDVVKEKINNLPKNTVIIATADYKDNAGIRIPTTESSKILFADCNLPVYSSRYTYLNNGIIGGMLTNGKDLGINIGEITLRILNGEKSYDIPAIVDNSHKYVLDYNQLKRFNIEMSDIPENSEIINMPSFNYSISKGVLFNIAAGFISILILVIIFLLIMIRKLNNTKKLFLNSESLLKTIINSTPDIIYFKDPKGNLIEANNSILELLNINEKDYQFKSPRELSNPSYIKDEDMNTFEIYDNKAWEYNDVYRTEETMFYEKKNIQKTYDILRIPLFNEDKTPRGLVLIGRDITEHKANENNKKIINELRYYDKLRMEFFTNLSHELRTPLNVIFSSLQVLKGTLDTNQTDSKKINKYLSIMKQNCYRLIKLVNNFIDINKIESGYFSLQLQNIDIINVVEGIVLSVADYIESKGIFIVFDTEVEEKVISCDPNMVERIMLNLISNAIKFTNAFGSIIINVYYRNDSILISVKDTGIGIPIEKQKAIFKRFVQVDKSLSRNREGSGIGLSLVKSLVKSLVELHHGTITLVSEPNKGSEFIIRFPAELLANDKASITDNNLNEDKAETIKIEFSDIYS